MTSNQEESNVFSEAQLKEWKDFYDTNGYLVIPSFVTSEELDALKEEGEKLVENYFFDLHSSEYSIFSTLKQFV